MLRARFRLTRRSVAGGALVIGAALIVGSVPFFAQAATARPDGASARPEPGRELAFAVPSEAASPTVSDAGGVQRPNTTTEIRAVLPSAWSNTACGAARTFAGDEVAGWTCEVQNLDRHAVLYWHGPPAARDAGQAPVTFDFRATIPSGKTPDAASLPAVRQVYADGSTTIRRAVYELGLNLADLADAKSETVKKRATDPVADNGAPVSTSVTAVLPKGWLGARCGYALNASGDPVDGWSCAVTGDNDQVQVRWIGPVDAAVQMLAFGATSQFPGPDFGALRVLRDGVAASSTLTDLHFRSGILRTVAVDGPDIPGVKLPPAPALDLAAVPAAGAAAAPPDVSSDVASDVPADRSTATPTPAAPPVASPAATPVASPDSAPAQDPKFATCAEVLAAGYGPYVRGEDPEYANYPDPDGDGIACETGGAAAGPLAAAAAVTTPTPTPTPTPPPTPTPTPTASAPAPTPTPTPTSAPAPSGTVTPAPTSTPVATTQATTALDHRYATCLEAVAAGLGPYRQGVDPEYDWYIDADHDGYDCDAGPGRWHAAATADERSAPPADTATPRSSSTPSPEAPGEAATRPSPTPACGRSAPVRPAETATPVPSSGSTSGLTSGTSSVVSPTPAPPTATPLAVTGSSSVPDGGPLTFGSAPSVTGTAFRGAVVFESALRLDHSTPTPAPFGTGPTTTCGLPGTGAGSSIPLLEVALGVLFLGLVFLAFGSWARREDEWPGFGRYVRR